MDRPDWTLFTAYNSSGVVKHTHLQEKVRMLVNNNKELTRYLQIPLSYVYL